MTETWAHRNAIQAPPVIDSSMAATAAVHGLALVTRNEALREALCRITPEDGICSMA